MGAGAGAGAGPVAGLGHAEFGWVRLWSGQLRKVTSQRGTEQGPDLRALLGG